MEVKYYSLPDMMAELKKGQIVRIQGIVEKVNMGDGKFVIPHLSYQVHVTAKINGDIGIFVNRVALEFAQADKRRHNTVRKKTSEMEKETIKVLEEKGFKTAKGRFE